MATSKSSNVQTSASNAKTFFIQNRNADIKVNGNSAGFRPLHFNWTVRDRKAGSTTIEPLLRAEPNLNIIQRCAIDPAVREELATYFISRKLRGVIKTQMKSARVRVGDRLFMTDELVKAIRTSVSSDAASSVVCEIVFPAIHALGMLADTREYTTRVRYPVAKVTAAALANDVAMEEIVRVARGLKITNVLKIGDTFFADGFCSAFAEAFVSVGGKIVETNELGSVIDDMIRGVRAHIDPLLTGLKGTVPAAWANHTVINDLATCFPFVMAALQSIPVGSSVSVRNEMSKLIDWAPAVLAALKSSQRYGFISVSAIKADVGKRTIADLRGNPRCVVLHRSAKPNAAAQALYAAQDDFVSHATTVFQSRSRIDQAIAEAYGKPDLMSTDNAVAHFTSIIGELVDMGFVPPSLAYFFDVGSDNDISAFELACMISKEVELDFAVLEASSGAKVLFDPTTSVQPNWRFRVETDYKWAESWAGMKMLGRFETGTYLTCDSLEVLLMARDFNPTEAMAARPQLVDKAAFHTSLIGFDIDKETVAIIDELRYSATIGPVAIHGSLAYNSIGSLQSPKNIRVVIPTFNQEIFDAVTNVYKEIRALVSYYQDKNNQVTDQDINPLVVRSIHSRLALFARDLAWSIAPDLRALIQDRIETESTMNLPADAGLAMRARLSQSHFRAYIDIVALNFFLSVQGLDKGIADLALSDAEVLSELLRLGSDRLTRDL